MSFGENVISFDKTFHDRLVKDVADAVEERFNYYLENDIQAVSAAELAEERDAALKSRDSWRSRAQRIQDRNAVLVERLRAVEAELQKLKEQGT